MTIDTLLMLCHRYAQLGTSIQNQLRAVALEGEPVENQNSNAMKLVVDFLRSCDRLDVEYADDLIDEIEVVLRLEKNNGS